MGARARSTPGVGRLTRRAEALADPLSKRGNTDRRLARTGVVTAYPLRALAVLGIVGAAAEMFDEKVAQASEGVAAISQEAALRATARDSSWFGDWEDWIPYLGDIYGGTLNEDEDLLVREDQLISGRSMHSKRRRNRLGRRRPTRPLPSWCARRWLRPISSTTTRRRHPSRQAC